MAKKQITQEQVDAIVDRLVERMNKANELFLEQLGNSIKKIKDLKPSQAQKLVQMLRFGGNYEKIVKSMAKYADKNVSDIDEIFVAYSKKDQYFNEQFYKYKNIPFVQYNKNSALKKQTEALAKMVKKEMYDFTREKVLGYSIHDNKGNLIFQGLKDVYTSAIEEALMNVGQGKETFDSAMTKILKDIGQSGLKTIDYESGRSVRLDSVIRMHLKNSLNELHNENQELFGKQYGADGVEITVHEYPAPDHELVQGRQFSNAQFKKLQKGEEAKDYKGDTYTLDHDGKNGYRPISEMNCYHTIFSIVLGVSEPEYSDEELQKIRDDNNEKFEFDGKKYTKYEGTQLQRAIEREIRKQKDIQILAKSSGNKELLADAQERITILNYKYKDLCEQSGLKSKKQRMKVTGYKRTNVNRVGTSPMKPSSDLFEDVSDNSRNENNTRFVDIEASTLEEFTRLRKEYVDKNITYETSTRENYNTLKAKLDDDIVGEVRYETINGQNQIVYINTKEDYRRSGIATKLYKELQAKTPDKEIIITGFTDSGEKLIDKIAETKEYRNGKYYVKIKLDEGKQPYIDDFKFIIDTDDEFAAYDKYDEMSEESRNKLTTRERMLIDNEYVGTEESYKINEALREDRDETENLDKEWFKDFKEAMDKACETYTAKENMAGTRFVDMNYLRNVYGLEIPKYAEVDRFSIAEQMKEFIGSEIIPKSYTSFSLNEEGNGLFTNLAVKMKINIPDGTKMFVADNVGEWEAILGRNTEMILKDVKFQPSKVVGFEKEYGKVILIYEVKR